MPNPVFRFATVQDQSIHWFLKRNCSVTPVQLGWLYASLCVVSLGIGTVFWVQGAVLILPFAWAELAAVGHRVPGYMRGMRATARRSRCRGGRLVVELENAGHLRARGFLTAIGFGSSPARDRSLIELSGQGQR